MTLPDDQGETIRGPASRRGAGTHDPTVQAPGDASEFDERTLLSGDRPLIETAEKVGRYPIEGHLGAGGMGEVLEVTDTRLGRAVAAKVIRGQADKAAVRKFEQEAQVTGQLEHPGIVPVYELGIDANGKHFFTMKRVEGQDLGGILAEERKAAKRKRRKRSLASLLRILRRVCEAMAFAHSKGVIHRDLKPENIMVGAFGEVLVMDWGLARLLRGADARGNAPSSQSLSRTGSGDDPMVTMDGTVLGTPSYMPPEQAEGRIGDLDERTDVYALGAILYEMLTLSPPYVGPTVYATLELLTTSELVPPERRTPAGRDVPWELGAIATRALSKDKEDRYPDMLSFKADIEAYLEGMRVSAASYSAFAALKKWIGRNKHLVQASVAVLVTALAIGGWWIKTDMARSAEEQAVVAAARTKIDDLAPDKLLGKANALLLAVRSSGARLGATPDQLQRISALVSKLRVLSEAYGKLALLQPDDLEARDKRHRVLLTIGRLAVAARDDSLAEFALGQAAQLGVEGSPAVKELMAASKARSARLARQARAIEKHLAAAAEGALDSQHPYRVALVEIASYRERQTVELLLASLRAQTASLKQAARDTILSVATPTAAERKRGWKEMRDLPAAVDAWLATRVPATAKGVPADLPVATYKKLLLAFQRLELRNGGGMASGKQHWRRVVASAQNEALMTGGRSAPRRLALTCDALALLDETRGTVDALGRYLWLEQDELRAVPAGRALAWLGRRAPLADEIVLNLVGMSTKQPRRPKWGGNGPFWNGIREVRVRARPSTARSSKGLTALQLHRRASARLAARQFKEALADINAALKLDPRMEKTCRITRAIILTQSGQFGDAMVDLTFLVENHPSALTWANRAHLYMTLGIWGKAIADCTRSLALDRNYVSALSWRGRCYFERNELNKAQTDLDRAIQLNSRDMYALMYRAKVRQAQKNYRLAHQDLLRALEIDENFVGAYLARADLYLTTGKLREARADCDRALELRPNSGSAYFLRARVRRTQGDVRGALQDIDQAVRRQPKDAWVHGERGRILLAMGQRKDAIASFTRSIELKPRQYSAYINRGNALMQLKRFPEALKDYDRAIKTKPGLALIYFNRGLVLSKMGDDRGAIRDFDKAIKRSPRYTKAWSQRGISRMALGDLAGALADCNKAVSLSPRSARAHRQRGQVHSAAGKFAEALKDYDRAIKLLPSYGDAWQNRGYVKMKLKRWKLALVDLNRAIELNGRSGSAYSLRAQTRHALKDIDGAMKDFAAGIELSPRFPGTYASRGEALLAMGKSDRAIADLRKAVQLGLSGRIQPAYYLQRLATALVSLKRRADAIRELETALPKLSFSKREHGKVEKLLASLRKG